MDPLIPLTDRLRAEGRLRVWSLVITVFGDSVQPRGGQIALARLARLLGRIGVESGALRTALSRLSQDGWVVGARSGRTSTYRLTEKGTQTFGPASSRIYAPPRSRPVTIWAFEAGPTATGLPVAGGFLRPADQVDGAAEFRITGTLSAGARAAVAAALPQAHLTALGRMAEDLTDLHRVDPDDGLAAAAARTLLIHRWRRLVLRWPEVPPEMMPDDFVPRDMTAAVALCYRRLSPGADRWLSTADDDLVPMPEALPEAARRFGAAQEP